MRKDLGFRLYGIFGYPLSHTLSPRMQEAAFSKYGLKAFYLTLELRPRDFQKLIRKLDRFLIDGFNVTVPYKETVFQVLCHLTAEARAMKAVNTVFRRKNRWVGTNTDVGGFLDSLRFEGRFTPKGKTVLVLGAGGSARAVVYGLAEKKAKKIYIFNRHPQRARRIAGDYKKLFRKVEFEVVSSKNGVKELIEEASLVVNATSVGLKKNDPSLIPISWIPKAKTKKLFMDLIYRPRETKFLKNARRRGYRTLNGSGMLLFQGARSFEMWTQKKAPLSVMRSALMEAFKEKEREKF
ncbi:MAG: shikimate dehydrogenase [Candidatus Omnitrophica bacterium]|nr:shikimate dehydrogenase [Candidatus Omnitrophota bacterium]